MRRGNETLKHWAQMAQKSCVVQQAVVCWIAELGSMRLCAQGAGALKISKALIPSVFSGYMSFIEALISGNRAG